MPTSLNSPRHSRVHKRLIDTLSLVVSLILLPGLFLEPLTLIERIVQLGVSVTDLLGRDKGFESLAETRSRSVSFGQGGHDLGVSDDKGRVHTLVLDEFTDELSKQM
jgi:hypothetical protein